MPSSCHLGHLCHVHIFILFYGGNCAQMYLKLVPRVTGNILFSHLIYVEYFIIIRVHY